MWYSRWNNSLIYLPIFLLLAFTQSVSANETLERISGPYVHDNLAIYLIHGASARGPVPLTLDEALTKGAVRVNETGTVSQLTIENLSNEEIFIQSGDIVKGGKQDRVLTTSTILKPKSGAVPVDAYCVEAGRWAARGMENIDVFSTSGLVAPSRELKLALKSLKHTQRSGFLRAPDDPQQDVWKEVEKMQTALSKNLGARVAAAPSPSSLQLALENDKLKKAQTQFHEALKSKGETHDDIVGFAFAINGKLNSADIYSSNGLFRKMWPKLLNAAVTEAIANKGTSKEAKLPAPTEIAAELQNPAGEARRVSKNLDVDLETSESDRGEYFATRRANGRALHMGYISKY